MTYPVSPLVALVVAGLLLALARRRGLRVLGFALFLAGWLGSTPLVANLLVGSIERRADAGAAQCHDLQAIVLLTGGLLRAPASPDDVQALNTETLQRVMALLDRDDPALPLLIAGGGPHAVKESQLAAAFLHRLAPRRSALLETTSRNTWENASRAAAMLPAPRRIALATSALHMPRAKRAFETAGFSVCPWPLNRQYVDATGAWALLPHGTAVRKTEAVAHELGGWIVYGWREPESVSE
jgi:uncharacterized SAM-binding protein YcdF (DUF218 family)